MRESNCQTPFDGPMCGACQGTERINGRVCYVTWSSEASPYDSASFLTPHDCFIEGNSIPCPYCLPNVYGDIRRVDIRKDSQKPERT